MKSILSFLLALSMIPLLFVVMFGELIRDVLLVAIKLPATCASTLKRCVIVWRKA